MVGQTVRMMSLHKYRWIFIAVVLTALALVYALWGINFQQLSELLSDANYWALPPFLVLLALFFWLKAVRWVLILRPLGRFSWTQAAPAMMIGFAGNNVLPAHLGELVRTAVFARRFRIPVSGVLVSIMLERILDVTSLVVLYFCAVAILGKTPGALWTGAWVIAGVLGAAFFAIFLLLLQPNIMLSLWDKCSRWLSASLHEKILSGLQNAIHALSSLKSPTTLILLMGYSLLQWLLIATNVWLTVWAFGFAIPPGVALIVLAVLSLAITVPSTPGYIGPVQAAFVFALVPFGVSNELAFAASVFYLVAYWIPVTVVGALFFVSTGLRVGEVRSDVEEAANLSNAE